MPDERGLITTHIDLRFTIKIPDGALEIAHELAPDGDTMEETLVSKLVHNLNHDMPDFMDFTLQDFDVEFED